MVGDDKAGDWDRTSKPVDFLVEGVLPRRVEDEIMEGLLDLMGGRVLGVVLGVEVHSFTSLVQLLHLPCFSLCMAGGHELSHVLDSFEKKRLQNKCA